jgi:hypothetical protein
MSKDKSNKGWFGRHKVLTIAGVIVVLIVIGSVAASNNKTTVNTTASTSSNGTGSRSSSNSSSATAHVGSTVNIGGSKGLGVTLTQVIDPASGADQYTTADAGKRFVAVDLKITNNGTAAFSDDANSDVTLIGTDNQSYTADFDSVSECTNFNSGQFTLSPGESSTGCVVFQVPNGVNTAKVQFQTESGFSGSTGEWLVP